jgi:hypothetical protein
VELFDILPRLKAEDSHCAKGRRLPRIQIKAMREAVA